jgi:hypothetical protein
MGLFDSQGSTSKFLLQYLIGFLAFWGGLLAVFFFFNNSDSVVINADGEVHLGAPETYFQFMYVIGPAILCISMILSSILVGLMTGVRKGAEAMFIGIACTLLVGFFVTNMISGALDSNFYDATGTFGLVEIPPEATYASNLFIGNLMLWANFLLEVIRFKPEKVLAEL